MARRIHTDLRDLAALWPSNITLETVLQLYEKKHELIEQLLEEVYEEYWENILDLPRVRTANQVCSAVVSALICEGEKFRRIMCLKPPLWGDLTCEKVAVSTVDDLTGAYNVVQLKAFLVKHLGWRRYMCVRDENDRTIIAQTIMKGIAESRVHT